MLTCASWQLSCDTDMKKSRKQVAHFNNSNKMNQIRKSKLSENDSGQDSDINDYRQRRNRNNDAVRRSREKSQARSRKIAERVMELRRENHELEGRLGVLTAELKVLKDVLLVQARGKKRRRSETDYDQSEDTDINKTRCQLNVIAMQRDHYYESGRLKSKKKS